MLKNLRAHCGKQINTQTINSEHMKNAIKITFLEF